MNTESSDVYNWYLRRALFQSYHYFLYPLGSINETEEKTKGLVFMDSF